MFKFLLGVFCTLAVLHPTEAKHLLNQAVDTLHSIASGVLTF